MLTNLFVDFKVTFESYLVNAYKKKTCDQFQDFYKKTGQNKECPKAGELAHVQISTRLPALSKNCGYIFLIVIS